MGVLKPWPTTDDLVRHLRRGVSAGAGPDHVRAQQAMDAVIDYVQTHCSALYDVDNPPLITDPILPAAAWDGMLLLAAKHYGRRNTPDGVQGDAEFGPIRVNSFDPDVDRMLGPWVDIRVAGA